MIKLTEKQERFATEIFRRDVEDYIKYNKEAPDEGLNGALVLASRKLALKFNSLESVDQYRKAQNDAFESAKRVFETKFKEKQYNNAIEAFEDLLGIVDQLAAN